LESDSIQKEKSKKDLKSRRSAGGWGAIPFSLKWARRAEGSLPRHPVEKSGVDESGGY